MLVSKPLRNVLIEKVRYKRKVKINFNDETLPERIARASKIAIWLETNCVGRYRVSFSEVMFENKHDATLFVLAFS